MKTFEQYFHDSGTGGYPLRDILDNLADEEIEDSVKEFAQEYAQKVCKHQKGLIKEFLQALFEDREGCDNRRYTQLDSLQ